MPVNNNAGGNSKSGDSGNNSENSGGSSSGKNSNSQQSSVIEKSETSKTTNNSSSKTDSSKTNNNKNNNNNSNKNNNNSNKNNNSSSSKSDSSKSDDSNSKSLKIGGKTFNVGDTIVCTYNLTTPAVLENYQATIKYDSSKLTCKSAKMSVPAKYGAMLNIKIAGEISLSGVNIGDGYDYTNGGAFMTVVYEVKGGGSTSPSYHWEVACRASDSKNLIDKKGKPASGFKLSSSYKD
nr:cohesin domain-containing protein [Ruminococcus sp. AM28-29LB]